MHSAHDWHSGTFWLYGLDWRFKFKTPEQYWTWLPWRSYEILESKSLSVQDSRWKVPDDQQSVRSHLSVKRVMRMYGNSEFRRIATTGTVTTYSTLITNYLYITNWILVRRLRTSQVWTNAPYVERFMNYYVSQFVITVFYINYSFHQKNC